MSADEKRGEVKHYKPSDLTEYLNIYSQEYNNSEIHDRVLVLDVVKDYAYGYSGPDTTLGKAAHTTNNEENVGNISKQSEEHSSLCETVNPVNKKRSSNLDDSKWSVTPKKPRRRGKFVHSKESETTAVDAEFGETRANPDIDDSETGPLEMNEEQSSPPASTETKVIGSEVLRQHKIFVHATWLAVHSTYFRSLFYSGLKESAEKEVHLKVPECEEKGHMQLLEAMYSPDVLNTASVDELLLVLEFADKYAVKFVFRKAMYVLMETQRSIEICEKILYVIRVKQSLANVDYLASSVRLFLVQAFSPLDKRWQTDNFLNLSETSLRLLLISDDLVTQSENTVFHALMQWVERNHYEFYSPTSSIKSPLLSVVRFGLLTIDYLYNVVQYHPIATKMAGFADLYLKGVSYHALPQLVRERMKEKLVMRMRVEKLVQYTWTLKKEKLEMLDNGKTISSKHFWWCGYEMKLTMDNRDRGPSINKTVIINLHSLGLRRESAFMVKWNCKGLKLVDSAVTTHTFTSEQSKSMKSMFIRCRGPGGVIAYPERVLIQVTVH